MPLSAGAIAGEAETVSFQRVFPAVLDALVARLPMPSDPSARLRCCFGVPCAEGEACAAAYACPEGACPGAPDCNARQ